MNEPPLPFGETEANEDDIWKVVSIEPAIDALATQGQSRVEARQRIEALISAILPLLRWLAANGCKFPWRQTTDPW